MADSQATNQRWWSEETVAVVTGANKGIGFEIVRQLASNAIQVVLTARNEERGLSAVNNLKESGLSNIVFHQLDVQDPMSISVFAEWMKQPYGKIDILVNNAGVGGVSVDIEKLKALKADPTKIIDLKENRGEGFTEDYETAQTCIDINFNGSKRTTEALLPLLKLSDHSGSRIVNMSSSFALLKLIPSEALQQELRDIDNLTEEKLEEFVNRFLEDFREKQLENNGWPLKFSAYRISKAALNAYTRILARRYPNMYVNSVEPGFVRTDMNFNTGVVPVEEGAQVPTMVALLPPGGPSGRYFNLKEIAEF
eukprot:Gb_21198 [translate_table: standard]